MHFLVGHREVQDLFVDPFGGGILLTERECAALLKGRRPRTGSSGTGATWLPSLTVSSSRE